MSAHVPVQSITTGKVTLTPSTAVQVVSANTGRVSIRIVPLLGAGQVWLGTSSSVTDSNGFFLNGFAPEIVLDWQTDIWAFLANSPSNVVALSFVDEIVS